MAVDQDLAAQGKCGAGLRDGSGNHCQHEAGWGTSHFGTGRCKVHGGADGSGRPIVHGRYSNLKSPRLQELITEHEADPDPLNLLPEIHLLRGLVQDFIERYDTMSDALLAWHQSFGTDGTAKPHKILDITAAAGFIAALSTLADRIEKRREKGSLSMATVKKVLDQYALETMFAAQAHIHDPDLQAKLLNDIEERWGRVRVEA